MQGNDDDDDERGRQRFEANLQMIRSNKCTELNFCSVLHNRKRWTVVQAQELLTALTVHKTVVRLSIVPKYCPLPAFPLLLKYIQSNSTLEEVNISTIPDNYFAEDSEATREEYDNQIGPIFRAILKNPSIKKFCTAQLGNSPEAVFDLLSKTTTLTSFGLHCSTITSGMVRAVAGGLARSSSLDDVYLCLRVDDRNAIVSGIVPSAIKSLSVDLFGSIGKCFSTISNALPVCLKLKTLLISNEGEWAKEEEDGNVDGDSGFDQFFRALGEPSCCLLENLLLRHVGLNPQADLSDISSIPNVNRNLRVLELDSVDFPSRSSVRFLWHLVGLKELCVLYPSYIEGGDTAEDCWAEVVQRNPSLVKLTVHDTIWSDCAEGLVRGACGHESLEGLYLDSGVGEDFLDEDYEPIVVQEQIGAQLCQLCRQSKSLKMLSLSSFAVDPRGSELLEAGICQSTSLRHFVLNCCSMTFTVVTMIVECFVINQTVKKFDIVDCRIQGSDEDKRIFCQALSNVFRVNTSLESFRLPAMEINGTNGLMNTLVNDGLAHNKAIQSIDLSACTADEAAMNCLTQALVADDESPNALLFSAIKLPILADDGINAFLRNLVHMPSIKDVSYDKQVTDLDEDGTSLDEEGKQLLLEAVKSKKTLLSFVRHTDERVKDPVDAKIDFYLKLNRYGRQVVESTNVPASYWPILLGRMAKAGEPSSNHDNMDALFYFLSKYFSSHGISANYQQHQEEEEEQVASRSKRARLE